MQCCVLRRALKMASIETKRNRQILKIDCYIIDKFSANSKLKFWKCRRKDICPMRVHISINNLQIIKLPTREHTHDSEAVEIEADIEKMETTSTIINKCVNGLVQTTEVSI